MEKTTLMIAEASEFMLTADKLRQIKRLVSEHQFGDLNFVVEALLAHIQNRESYIEFLEEELNDMENGRPADFFESLLGIHS